MIVNGVQGHKAHDVHPMPHLPSLNDDKQDMRYAPFRLLMQNMRKAFRDPFDIIGSTAVLPSLRRFGSGKTNVSPQLLDRCNTIRLSRPWGYSLLRFISGSCRRMRRSRFVLRTDKKSLVLPMILISSQDELNDSFKTTE